MDNAPIQRKNDTDSDKHVINTLSAFAIIVGTGKYKGHIECPSCKGKLHFTRAKSNGHVWAKCETKDCISFIQ